MTRTLPYSGSIQFIQAAGLNLEYALLRIAAHYFGHAAEIGMVRARLGHAVPDHREWGKLFL